MATLAHPNQAIEQTLALCDAKLVAVTGDAIDKLVGEQPFLSMVEIPADVYPGMDGEIATFGVTVTAVGSSDTDDETVSAIVGSVFGNLTDLKRIHPSLATLVPEHMIVEGLSVPLHPGAIGYFRDQGMM